MRITVIGTGYVGLVVGTGFAENGHRVMCVDRDENVIQQLESGKMPFYEPGLEELVMRNREEERLHFTTDLAGAVGDCLLVFLCVGTPELEPGVMDTSQVFDVADRVADAACNLATVPAGRVAVAACRAPADLVVDAACVAPADRRVVGVPPRAPVDPICRPRPRRKAA